VKVFVLAVLVLAVTFGVIGWWSWYVERLSGNLLDILEKLPEEEGQLVSFGVGYESFRKHWERGEIMLHIFVGHDAADRVEELLEEMGMRYIGKDMTGYMTVREILVLQIQKIRTGDKVAVDSIL